MTAFVTRVTSDGHGDRQEFDVHVTRLPVGYIDFEPPVTDLPEDVRAALLSWLGAGR